MAALNILEGTDAMASGASSVAPFNHLDNFACPGAGRGVVVVIRMGFVALE